MLDVIKFILNHGDHNVARDGDLKHGNHIVAEDSEGDGEPAAEPVQRHRVTFGCCGQAFSVEYIEGHCAPKSTYGFGVFDKIEDEEERALIKQMLADAFDCMQQCEDHIEQFKLKNPLPFSDPPSR